MTTSPNLRVRGLAIVLLGMSAPALAGPATTAAIEAIPQAGAIQLTAMGDLPTVPQRRGGGRRRAKGKDKPYQPLAKDVQGESADAHKDYLKRYGF